jgi:hypothetical protein
MYLIILLKYLLLCMLTIINNKNAEHVISRFNFNFWGRFDFFLGRFDWISTFLLHSDGQQFHQYP